MKSTTSSHITNTTTPETPVSVPVATMLSALTHKTQHHFNTLLVGLLLSTPATTPNTINLRKAIF